MQLTCPACKAAITIKEPKPGRFTPTCPKCLVPFLLVVPPEAGGTVTVGPLPPAERPTVPFPPPQKAADAEAPAAKPAKPPLRPTIPFPPPKKPE